MNFWKKHICFSRWRRAGQLAFICLVLICHPLIGEEKTPPVAAFQQRLSSLNVRDADVRDVIRMLAKKYQVNLLIANDVDKRLTLNLSDISLEDALNYIVNDNQLSIKKYGEIYKIVNAPAPLPAPKIWDIEYHDGKLSLNVHREDVREVVAEIARVSGQTVLCDKAVNGHISGNLKNAPFETGLKELFRANGFLLKKAAHGYFVRAVDGYSPTTAKGAKGTFWIDYNQNGLSIDVQNISLGDVLSEISRQSAADFIVLGEAKGKVNARMANVSLEEGLNLILLSSEFTFKKSRNVYLIGGKNNQGLSSSRLLKLKHLKVDGILDVLPKQAVRNAEMKIIREHNALLVTGAGDVLSEVAEIIHELDQPIPQIFFEVLVVDFNDTDVSELTLSAGEGTPVDEDSSGNVDATRWLPEIRHLFSGGELNDYLTSLGKYFSGVNIGKLPEDFYLQIAALEKLEKVDIRSKPQISTLNGHPAQLKIGETRYFKLDTETPLGGNVNQNLPYIATTERFETVDINISLEITPWVSASGEITVEIHPEFNTVDGENEAGLPPNIRSRSLTSTVRLRDGETIVLGGLIEERETESTRRFPLLGRLPLLGKLFSSRNVNKSKSELIIYVTPHLSYSDNWMLP